MLKDANKKIDEQSLWQLAEEISLPASYWNGQTIHAGFAPDNILIFPYDRKPFRSNLGSYHPRFVLDVILGHPGTLRIGEANYRMEVGDCALIMPHQFNYAPNDDMIGGHDASRPGWVVVTFDLREPQAIEALRNSPRRMRPADRSLLRRLMEAYRHGEPALHIAYHLSQLLHSLCGAPAIPGRRQNIESTHPERDELLEKINHYLYQNQSRALKASDLAKGIGYSESQLKRLFRCYTGKNIVHHIRHRRLAEAARRLQSPGSNVSDVARQLGFSSVNAFSRMFKMAYGLPPKQYEKVIQENGKLAASR
ncbi:MAG TPA: helix-turn-helix transcriptional regulator [Chthoniobacteraceae bacterium]|nr:helix-turn-helix transcriptional regulator [Chthoniobacteraceae bacterium]